jgi:hypothetical protein
VSVPTLIHVVQDIRARYPDHFPDQAMLCRYCDEVVGALHAVDARFGHLRKQPWQSHCQDAAGRLHARDVALFEPSGQIVDFILDAGWGPDTKNAVVWGVGPEGEYGADDWFAPGESSIPPPVPPPSDPIAHLQGQIYGLVDLLHVQGEHVQLLEARLEAVNAAMVQRTDDLRLGRAGPDYEGVAQGAARIFGLSVPVTITVRSKPVLTEP